MRGAFPGPPGSPPPVEISRPPFETRMPAAESHRILDVRFRFPAVFALSALLAGGCGGERKPPDAQGIPIGFFGALSGPQATFALSGKNGAKLAADQLNRA